MLIVKLRVKVHTFSFFIHACILGVQITNQEIIGRKKKSPRRKPWGIMVKTIAVHL